MADAMPFRIVRLGIIFVFCGLLLATTAGAGESAVPVPEWDGLFQNASGWIGADGDYSIPLATNRTLWLFSDTLVGEVRDGKRTNSVMVHNSIALQNGTNRPAFFHGRTPEGKPAAFLRPDGGVAGGYFWLSHGVRTKNGLYFFAVQVVTIDTKSPFGFKLVDGWLIHVANPDSPPSEWQTTQSRVPFSKMDSRSSLIFGGAVLAQDNFIYIFGSDSRPAATTTNQINALVVARVTANRIGDFKQWQFWSNGRWQRDAQKVTPLFNGLGSEFSVSRLASSGKFTAVYSEGIDGRIVIRTSPALTGPWSGPRLIYRCPEMEWSSKNYCYAAKAHPELMPGTDELLITYAANSWNFWDLFTDARLYWPRFVRVRLTEN